PRRPRVTQCRAAFNSDPQAKRASLAPSGGGLQAVRTDPGKLTAASWQNVVELYRNAVWAQHQRGKNETQRRRGRRDSKDKRSGEWRAVIQGHGDPPPRWRCVNT